jgi:hypothetical protein
VEPRKESTLHVLKLESMNMHQASQRRMLEGMHARMTEDVPEDQVGLEVQREIEFKAEGVSR